MLNITPYLSIPEKTEYLENMQIVQNLVSDIQTQAEIAPSIGSD